jgi:hypothetical protein
VSIAAFLRTSHLVLPDDDPAFHGSRSTSRSADGQRAVKFTSRQLFLLRGEPDVANVDLDDASKCGARIDTLAGRRRVRGGMRGSVLRHARSIGAKKSGNNSGPGWAVAWAVRRYVIEISGVTGLEPVTSCVCSSRFLGPSKTVARGSDARSDIRLERLSAFKSCAKP